MRILVTYAVQGEFTELKFPGLIGEEEVQVGYLRTGIGKVKSAFYLAEAISSAQPDLVVNVYCPSSGGGYFGMPSFHRPRYAATDGF